MLGANDPILEHIAHLPPAEKVILMLYVAHANGNRTAWLSTGRLAKLSGFSRGHTWRARQSLVARGYLIPDGFVRGSHGQGCPRFRVADGAAG